MKECVNQLLFGWLKNINQGGMHQVVYGWEQAGVAAGRKPNSIGRGGAALSMQQVGPILFQNQHARPPVNHAIYVLELSIVILHANEWSNRASLRLQ